MEIKISIVFTIHLQVKSVSAEIFWEISNIYIIKKPSTIKTTQKMIM